MVRELTVSPHLLHTHLEAHELRLVELGQITLPLSSLN